VDAISFAESEKSFPRIQAALVVNAYVYGDAPVPGAAPPAAVPATTTASTSTLGETPTTTTATTPDTPPAGATAAPGGTP